MALITEVENHGEFVWRWSNGSTVTPEYRDGHGDSFATPGSAVRTSEAGWFPEGTIQFSGTFQPGDNISVTWIIRNLETGYEEQRGAAGDIPYPCDAETAALLFGNFINGNVDTCGAQGGGELTVAPAQMPAGTQINLGPPVVTLAP